MAVVLALMVVTSVPEEVNLVGLWESKATSSGGIGHAMEFRADGTFVQATTVIVDTQYRLVGDRLVVGPEAPGASADASKSPSFRVEGDVLVRTGPDGSVLREDRLTGREKGTSPIVGGWRYCHPTGAVAYERYTEAGRMLFRLPMQSSEGRYALSGNTLTLTPLGLAGQGWRIKPQPPDVKLTVEVRGDDLVVAKSDGEKAEYRREKAGAWYDLEHVEKCSQAPSEAPHGAGQIFRVGGDVLAPKLLNRVEPSYPRAAREKRIEGVVILEAKLTESGNVSDIAVLKSVHPLVDEAAVQAVRQWRYSPATLNGTPVSVYLTVTTTFNLDRIAIETGVKPRPRDSLVGNWYVPGQRIWVWIGHNRAYQCRITGADVVSKAVGVVDQTSENTIIHWESSSWPIDFVRRDGDELLLTSSDGIVRFHPVDGKMPAPCAQK